MPAILELVAARPDRYQRVLTALGLWVLVRYLFVVVGLFGAVHRCVNVLENRPMTGVCLRGRLRLFALVGVNMGVRTASGG
jgi:hypothetical protein